MRTPLSVFNMQYVAPTYFYPLISIHIIRAAFAAGLAVGIWTEEQVNNVLLQYRWWQNKQVHNVISLFHVLCHFPTYLCWLIYY